MIVKSQLDFAREALNAKRFDSAKAYYKTILNQDSTCVEAWKGYICAIGKIDDIDQLYMDDTFKVGNAYEYHSVDELSQSLGYEERCSNREIRKYLKDHIYDDVDNCRNNDGALGEYWLKPVEMFENVYHTLDYNESILKVINGRDYTKAMNTENADVKTQLVVLKNRLIVEFDRIVKSFSDNVLFMSESWKELSLGDYVLCHYYDCANRLLLRLSKYDDDIYMKYLQFHEQYRCYEISGGACKDINSVVDSLEHDNDFKSRLLYKLEDRIKGQSIKQFIDEVYASNEHTNDAYTQTYLEKLRILGDIVYGLVHTRVDELEQVQREYKNACYAKLNELKAKNAPRDEEYAEAQRIKLENKPYSEFTCMPLYICLGIVFFVCGCLLFFGPSRPKVFYTCICIMVAIIIFAIWNIVYNKKRQNNWYELLNATNIINSYDMHVGMYYADIRTLEYILNVTPDDIKGDHGGIRRDYDDMRDKYGLKCNPTYNALLDELNSLSIWDD